MGGPKVAAVLLKVGGARIMEVVAALSELAERLRGHEGKRISRHDFDAMLKRHLSGSRAEQIAQLWEKVAIRKG